MEYQLIIEKIEPTKIEELGKDRQFYPNEIHYSTRPIPPAYLNVRISEKQFEAIRKAVLENF